MLRDLDERFRGLTSQPGFWSLSDVINILLAMSRKLDNILAKLDQIDAKLNELAKARQ